MALHIKPGPILRTNLSLSLQWGNGLPNPSKPSEHGPYSSSDSVVSLRHEPQVARAHTCTLLLVHVEDTCRRPLRRDMPCMDCRAAAAMPGAAAAGATCAASSTLSVARCRWPWPPKCCTPIPKPPLSSVQPSPASSALGRGVCGSLHACSLLLGHFARKSNRILYVRSLREAPILRGPRDC